jgi:hypothetical protein
MRLASPSILSLTLVFVAGILVGAFLTPRVLGNTATGDSRLAPALPPADKADTGAMIDSGSVEFGARLDSLRAGAEIDSLERLGLVPRGWFRGSKPSPFAYCLAKVKTTTSSNSLNQLRGDRMCLWGSP